LLLLFLIAFAVDLLLLLLLLVVALTARAGLRGRAKRRPCLMFPAVQGFGTPQPPAAKPQTRKPQNPGTPQQTNGTNRGWFGRGGEEEAVEEEGEEEGAPGAGGDLASMFGAGGLQGIDPAALQQLLQSGMLQGMRGM
jgi:hypothetical protein